MNMHSVDNTKPAVNKHRKKDSLANRICFAMMQENIKTQCLLATLVGCSRQTAHTWITRGSIQIEPRLLFKLADVLKVSARWLVFGEDAEHGYVTDVPALTSQQIRCLNVEKSLHPKIRESWIRSGESLTMAIAAADNVNRDHVPARLPAPRTYRNTKLRVAK